jgi:secondary thiamine-phosphate synthase enzyme
VVIKTDTLTINTKGNCDVIDLTPHITGMLEKLRLNNGNVTVFVTGSTASISTIEYEPGLKKDLPEILETLIPAKRRYFHHDTWGDYNGHAHIRSTLIGCSQTIPFVKGNLMLGTWQQVILIDFDDRPRTRRVTIQYIGE